MKLILLIIMFISSIAHVANSKSSQFAQHQVNGLDHRLVIDPRLDIVSKRQIRKSIVAYFCDQHLASPGERVIAYHGGSGVELASFTLESQSYDTPRSRERKMRGFVDSLRRWEQKESEAGAVNMLRIPEIMESVARNADENTRIYFWGDCVYTNSHAPEFDFVQEGRMGVPPRSSLDEHPMTHPFGCKSRSAKSGASVFMVTSLGETFDSRYLHQLEEFYDAFFQAQAMHELQYFGVPGENVLTSLFAAEIKTAKRIESISESLLAAENPEAIHRSGVNPNAMFGRNMTVFIPDNSPSQNDVIERITKRLEQQESSPALNYSLVLFGKVNRHAAGPNAHLHATTNDPDAMARYFRNAPKGGMDELDALSSALMVTRDLLRAEKSKGAAIVVMSDVAPTESSNVPAHSTYGSLLNQLATEGHKLVFVKSHPQQSTDWIPEGTFEIEEL